MDRSTLDENAAAPGQAAAEAPRRTLKENLEKRRLEVKRLAEIGKNLATQLEQQVQKRPMMVVGAVGGLGFVAGSLFGSRLGQVVLAIGIGYALRNVATGDLGAERIQEGISKLTGESDTL